MDDALQERVDALERAIADGDRDLSGLADAAEVGARLDGLETDLAEMEDRVAELEAATQALRGYVGNIRSVNRDVEQRADRALATAEALERNLADGSVGRSVPAGDPSSGDLPEGATVSAGEASDRPTDDAHAGTERSPGHCPECGHRREGAGVARTTDGLETSGTPDNGAGIGASGGGETVGVPESGAGVGATGGGEAIEASDGGEGIGASDGLGTLGTAGASFDEQFGPDEPEETGTLRRIRELL